MHGGSSLVVLFVPALALGQASGASPIHREVRETYGFHPHELTTKEIEQKSALLDRFWENAKAKRATYLPALREELKDFGNPAFFLYDGSVLLLSLSDLPSDRSVALAAMARCDLRDVQPDDYFRRVHGMATSGEDTTEAALHILDDPGFRVIVPQHALTLGQNYSLIYMLLPVDPQRWLARVIGRLSKEPETTAQKSLLLLLWYAQTREADEALRGHAAGERHAEPTRAYARELLARRGRIDVITKARAALQSEEALRAERRKILDRVSDEALIELDEKTAQIVAKRF